MSRMFAHVCAGGVALFAAMVSDVGLSSAKRSLRAESAPRSAPSPSGQQSRAIDSLAKPPIPGGQLKMVQVMFRHGARTPLSPMYWDGIEWDVCGAAYPRAPMRVTCLHTGDELPHGRDEPPNAALQPYPGGCTRGELTLLGQRQARELGQWLRQRYVDEQGFLPREMVEGTLTGCTTNFRRTRDTLHGVLTGLYPESTGFEVTSTSALDDMLTANVRSCGRLKWLYKSAKRLVAAKTLADERIAENDRRIRAKLGLSLDSDEDRIHWSKLHDALTSRQAHAKPLPPQLNATDLEDVNRQATADMLAVVADDSYGDIVKLSMGRLLHTVESKFEEAVRGTAEAKLVLWSGHDTTIMPVLVALGQEVTEWPPYISTIVLELWADPAAGKSSHPEERHFVRMIFNQNEIKLPDLPPDRPLTLAAFRERVLAAYALSKEQHAKECHVTHDSSLPEVVDTSQY